MRISSTSFLATSKSCTFLALVILQDQTRRKHLESGKARSRCVFCGCEVGVSVLIFQQFSSFSSYYMTANINCKYQPLAHFLHDVQVSCTIDLASQELCTFLPPAFLLHQNLPRFLHLSSCKIRPVGST